MELEKFTQEWLDLKNTLAIDNYTFNKKYIPIMYEIAQNNYTESKDNDSLISDYKKTYLKQKEVEIENAKLNNLKEELLKLEKNLKSKHNLALIPNLNEDIQDEKETLIDSKIISYSKTKLNSSNNMILEKYLFLDKESIITKKKKRDSNWKEESKPLVSKAASIILNDLEKVTRENYRKLQGSEKYNVLPSSYIINDKFGSWSVFLKYIGFEEIKTNTNKKIKKEEAKIKLKNSDNYVSYKLYPNESLDFYRQSLNSLKKDWVTADKDLICKIALKLMDELEILNYTNYAKLQHTNKFNNYLTVNNIRSVFGNWSDFMDYLNLDLNPKYDGLLDDLDLENNSLKKLNSSELYIYKRYYNEFSSEYLSNIHIYTGKNWCDLNKDFLCMMTLPVLNKINNLNTTRDYDNFIKKESLNSLPSSGTLSKAFGGWNAYKKYIGLQQKSLTDKLYD